MQILKMNIKNKLSLLITVVLLGILSAATESRAALHWGDITPKECLEKGYRKYSGILWDIVGSWEIACASTPGVVPGGARVPDTCVNTGYMWGEWKVSDPACGEPVWGSITPQGCVASNTMKYAAILWDIPSGVSWEDTCKRTPGRAPDGVRVPDRCIKSMLGPIVLNQWGEWLVNDLGCRCNWNLERMLCTDGSGREECRYVSVNTCPLVGPPPPSGCKIDKVKCY